MAYMQRPGRGNHPKTGHGLPSPFKQTDIELTKKYDKGKATLDVQREKGNTPGGMTVNKTTGEAKANSYERTFEEPSAANAFTARIKDSKGNEVGSAKAQMVSGSMVPNGGGAVDALRKKYAKDKSFTESSRHKNVDQYNATGGGTAPDKLSEDQKQTLIKLSKAKKV